MTCPWLHDERGVREQSSKLSDRTNGAVHVELSAEQQDGATKAASAARVVSGEKAPSEAKTVAASLLVCRLWAAWRVCAALSHWP
jgi:hypothetical protein